MAYKTRRDRRAAGGKAADTEPLRPEHGNQYNAQGSPEERSENAKSDGFKRGGRAKKDGGHVEGMKAASHLGRRARGGRTEKPMMRGGSPFSSAHSTSAPGNNKDGPGEQAPMIP